MVGRGGEQHDFRNTKTRISQRILKYPPKWGDIVSKITRHSNLKNWQNSIDSNFQDVRIKQAKLQLI